MKTRTSKILFGIILAASMMLLSTALSYKMAKATGESPFVTTDWPSYVPGEWVTISGGGFGASAAVTVNIQWPDGVRIDTISATTDASGAFTCLYQLPSDAEHGVYTVTATDQYGNTASTTFSGTEDFYGYNRSSLTDPVPGNWTKGNLGSNYVEGDFVSYQLYLDNASKVWGNNFTISFDFHQDNTNAVYIDGFDTSPTTGFAYSSTSALLPDGTPIRPTAGWTHIPTPEAGEAAAPGNAQITGYMDPYPPTFVEPTNPDGTTVADNRAFNVTNLPWNTFANGYVILFFRAHLALDIIWSHGLESALPTALDGGEFQDWTNAFHGSSFATGSSRHFVLQFPGLGAKAIPIPITTYPSTLINGYKYVDNVLFNGWNITLMGNLTLGSGLPPIPYNPPVVQTGTGTFANGSAWPTGYFEFTGLVTGDYNVTEENRAGYTHVNIIASGNGTSVSTNIAEGWALFTLPGGGTETIRFYNTFAHPNITLTKTPSSTKVENGSLVTYTYNVTNTGNVQLTANLTDDQFGTIFTGKVLAPGESNITTISRVLTTNTTNIANVTATDGIGQTVNATATATVTVLHPDIALTKSVSSAKVENGTSVTYTFNVTNTGDTSLTVSLTDSVFGTLFTGKVLAPGASNITTVVSTLTANTTNTATATGVDQLGTSVNATASATVRVLHPSIDLTKVASSAKVENGTMVTYTYNVTNTGDVALTGNVTDNVFGLIGTFTNLQSGSFVTFTSDQVLTENTTNTATAIGIDQLGATATDQASAFVRVLHPALTLTKTPSSTKVENGTSVTYTYNVTNTGDVALTIGISDDQFGSITSGQSLAVGESKIFTTTVTLTQNTTNTATATGVDQEGGQATPQASAFVRVLHPSIDLTKVASDSKVENGTSVTYTYNVTNTGDVALTGNVTDDVFGLVGTFTNLQSGDFATFIVSHVLTANTTNTATAIGVDQLGATATDEASAFVRVLHPSIDLTKVASETKVENGTMVTYTYNVTNTGDVALTGNVTDNVFGLIGTFTNLQSGDFMTFTSDQVLTENTTNTATATGVDQLGATATDQASAFVQVIHPDISLTKTPSSTKVENGTSVTYTYNVTNTGDTPLTVQLIDSQFGTIFTGKVLAPGASNITTITETLTTNTTNSATATGVDQLGATVNVTKSATVTVIHPAISLTKTASPTKVENGTSVTYTYNVTNTGDTSLTVELTDNVFASPIFTGKVLAPGESNITIVSHVLTQNTTNTATATGVDQLSTSVNANASATVTVIHPAISLTKTASSAKVENGTTVTYTYNVTNTGDTTLTGNITDDVFGTVLFFTLPPNTWVAVSVPEVLTVNTTNTATAFGIDQLGTEVNATASATVTVLHPAIALTKTPSASKVVNGTIVTYTFNVTNTGDTTLVGVNITDNVLGIIATNQVLTPGQLLQFTKNATLTTDTINTATASGFDQLGTNATATASTFVKVIHPAISVDKTCTPDNQLAPGNITWTIVVKNIGDITLTNVNVTESRGTISNLTGFTLAPNQTLTITFTEFNLPPGTYYNNATAIGAFQLGTVSAWDDATCIVKPVFVLKQFTGVTVLPDGQNLGFNATLVSPTQVNVTGLKSGPYIYFNITYYFENSLNFLGSSFDGQAHNFTLWDKWGGNLLALGSPPISFNPAKGVNRLTLADGSTFRIDPTLTGTDSYRGYIGSGLDISNLASQGQAFITMHLGDQQNTTNPGNGKGTTKDGSSYDTDTVWYIGELGVNQSATLTLFIAPGKNPGGQLEFTSPGCTVINTGPRVRAYGNTYGNKDFLFAVDRTNTLTVCVSPK